MRKTNTLSKKQKIIHALSEDAVKNIEMSLNSLGKYLTLFLYYTGLRISEALNINISQIENRGFCGHPRKGSQRKNNLFIQKS